MYKYKIDLVTNKDIVEFVNIVSTSNGWVKLIDDNGFCVNGKSLLGAMASIEWNNLYCLSEHDIYFSIQKFCRE